MEDFLNQRNSLLKRKIIEIQKKKQKKVRKTKYRVISGKIKKKKRKLFQDVAEVKSLKLQNK